MLWLPPLKSADGWWRLPMADASAPPLLAALIEGASERAVAAVAGAVADDAGLALWALACAAARGEEGLQAVSALADWLAREGRRVLDWPEAAERVSADAAVVGEYQRLREASRAAARRAREGSPPGTEADRAYLIGLVRYAARCWQPAGALEQSSAERSPAGRRGVPPTGPGWLTAALANADSSGGVGFDSSLAARQVTDVLAQPASSCGASLVADLLPAIGQLIARAEAADERFDLRLESEKLASLAEFAAGAGHEVNNPIAVISGRAQLLLDGERDAERRRELAVINSQAMRVYEMISDLMLFARPPKPQLANCDLVSVLDHIGSEIAVRAAERHVLVERRCILRSAIVRADVTQVGVALRAICDNALSAMVGGGRLAIELVRCPTPPAGVQPGFAMTFRDTGPGISADVRRHLFDPYYSGRPAGRGLGLGLAKCWRIITNHAGAIEVESSPIQGAAFTVYLPAADSTSDVRI
jgi:signal transduction histidine kinase